MITSMRSKNKPSLALRRKVPAPNIVTVDAVRKIQQKFQVITLRRDGHTIAEIAECMGLTMETVRKVEVNVLNEIISVYSETTEEHRQIQLDRLDQLTKVYTPFATQTHKEQVVDPLSGQMIIVEVPPNPGYAALLLKIEERRAKLLSLDVPEVKRLDVTGIREYIGIRMDEV